MNLRWSGGTVLWLFNVSWVVTDRCSASVQAACEPIISSSLLVIAWNKYVWPSKCILFQPCKYVNTYYFSISSSSPPTLIYSAVCSEIVLLWGDKRVCITVGESVTANLDHVCLNNNHITALPSFNFSQNFYDTQWPFKGMRSVVSWIPPVTRSQWLLL